MKHLRALLVRMLLVLVAVAGLMLEGSCQTSGTGVKLCGRDFIRNVIISCGGSRWKRYLLEASDVRASFYSALLGSLDDGELSWSTEEPERNSPVPTRVSKALHSHFISQSGPIESSEDLEEEHGTLLSSAFQFPLEEKSVRFRHGTGMAKICCTRGCTRSDIMKLC